ncbi:MAG: hypothetical protein ACREH4_00450 [Vitreimonas sp.]
MNYELQIDETDAEIWAGAREPADYCSRDGALALKAMIEAYWRDRGQDVTIALHNVGFHPAIRAARFDVRSDMVNGMPRAVARMRGMGGAADRTEAFAGEREDRAGE